VCGRGVRDMSLWVVGSMVVVFIVEDTCSATFFPRALLSVGIPRQDFGVYVVTFPGWTFVGGFVWVGGAGWAGQSGIQVPGRHRNVWRRHFVTEFFLSLFRSTSSFCPAIPGMDVRGVDLESGHELDIGTGRRPEEIPEFPASSPSMSAPGDVDASTYARLRSVALSYAWYDEDAEPSNLGERRDPGVGEIPPWYASKLAVWKDGRLPFSVRTSPASNPLNIPRTSLPLARPTVAKRPPARYMPSTCANLSFRALTLCCVCQPTYCTSFPSSFLSISLLFPSIPPPFPSIPPVSALSHGLAPSSLESSTA
jgi:hypothetical protein